MAETPLKDRLIARIRATGPMRVSDYMAACLLDPEAGYYTTARPFGADGDFTTAPEISQMFGELLGLALAQSWMDQGSPADFTLAECGPGRGTLMVDILRATRAVPGFLDAAQIFLVEASTQLADIQRAALHPHPITWVEDVTALPDAPLFLIANEFLDALPIRQFQRDAEGWRERMVGAIAGDLSFGLSPVLPAASMPELRTRLADTAPGDIVETCAPAATIAARIGALVAEFGGVAMFIDYGNFGSRGDTFQAVKAHEFADPLAAPGRADLTAHVDFRALAKALAPASVTGMTAQGVLLARLGIASRAEALAARLTGHALEQHVRAFHRLTDPGEMGTLFQAIAAYGPGRPLPPGFSPNDA